MADQKLNILITARNLAKGVLGNLDKSLGSGAKSAEKLQGGLGGSVLKANLLSAAITGGVGLALNTVGSMASGLVKTFGQAADRQQALISNASSFAAVAGVGFDEAEGFVQRLNKSMSQTAAILPGTTRDYVRLANAITDDLIPAFRGLDGSLDQAGLQRSIENIASSAGALAAGSGVDAGNAGLGLQRALGGASISQLRQIQFFELNPGLLNALQGRLEGVGAESFGDVDIASRTRILEEEFARFAGPEYRRRISGTISSMLESFRSLLFDDQEGIFGFDRDLNAELKGTQSITTRLTRTVQILIGENGIFTKIGQMASSLIGGKDPLILVDGALQSFNTMLSVFDGMLGRFQFTGKLPDFNISGRINQLLGNFNEWLAGVDFQTLGERWGEIISDLARRTMNFIKAIDWGQVLTTISGIATGFRDFMLSYFKTTAENLVESLGRGIRDIGIAMGDGIRNLFDRLDQKIEDTFGVAISDLVNIVTGFATGGAIGGGLAIREALREPQVVTSGRVIERGRYQGIQPGDGGIMGGIISELSNKPRSSDLVVANTSEAILRPNQAQNLIMNSMAAGASAGGRSAPNINLTVSFAAGTLQEQAEQVIQVLEQQIMQATSRYLA